LHRLFGSAERRFDLGPLGRPPMHRFGNPMLTNHRRVRLEVAPAVLNEE
jgi:hypothetical protein